VSIVLDSSVTLSWFHEDEKSARTDRVLDAVVQSGAVVPAHWHLEIANGLQQAIRRRRITVAQRDAALESLAALAIAVDTETSRQAWSASLALSSRFALTVYDAAYLELAHRLGLPLASLDAELRVVGPALAVPLLPD
jgi:predicted nucleic acid-binding protein